MLALANVEPLSARVAFPAVGVIWPLGTGDAVGGATVASWIVGGVVRGPVWEGGIGSAKFLREVEIHCFLH